MSKKIDELNARIQAQTEKLEQLKAYKRKEDARLRYEKRKRERAADTRQKILIGAYWMSVCEKDENVKAELLRRLDVYLERPDDRALFGLSERSS